ncbi:MAG: AMP-binding protein [Acidimicrobiia bacterium]|nr:AMP-binding protein [Acidimicrobiia bacterium]
MKELVYHRLFLPALERDPSRTCLIDGEHRASVSEHGERVLRLASAMAGELGLRPDSRFAVLAANSHRFVELYHAGFLGAGIINPLNLRLAPTELAYILENSGTETVFVDATFSPLLEQARGDASGLRNVVLLGDGDAPCDASYEDLIASATPDIPPEPDESAPAVLMYTGGTTGLPKGVLCSQRAEMLNLYHIGMSFRIEQHDVYLAQTPMFHAASLGGLLSTPAILGTMVVIPFFEPGSVIHAIETHGVTFTVMVPTMIGLTMDHPDFDAGRLQSLTKLAYGASPMPEAVLDRLLTTFPHLDLYQAYGMTEASVVLTILSPADHREGGALLRSAGRPVPGAQITIRDAAGNTLPIGEEGEVCARAGNLMDEYWENPAATEEVFRDGWYHTGDMGRVDARGYLHLVDRVKDMIVTGGENVYSIEVENAISTHPDVAQVAVIGIPDEKWGEAVHAIVVPRPGTEPTTDEIVDWARKTIAGYKVPKSVELRTEPIPLSGALKPLKRELRKPYWEGRERAVN